MSNEFEPGTPGYDGLVDATLSIYIDGFRVPANAERSAKALLLWDLLTELELAVPPEWVAAVWHTQDVERGNAAKSDA